jgi:hypothetical protein
MHFDFSERNRGFRALLKGTGKGLLGLLAKPIGSVFDGASITFDSLKRFSQSGAESIHQMRLPRHLIHDIV